MNTQEKFIMSALADELEKFIAEGQSDDERSTINIARMLIKEQSIEDRLMNMASVGADVTVRPILDGVFEIDVDFMNGDSEQFCNRSLEKAIFDAEQDIYFGNHFVRL